MSYQKNTKGAFIDLIGDAHSYTKPERFSINSPLLMSEELRKLTLVYNSAVDQIIGKLRYLAKLEELILQVRAMENLSEIKLSVVRENYIYARSPFIRIGSSTNDLRVIVGKTNVFGKDLMQLENNPVFMNTARLKMLKAMKKLIQKSAAQLPGLGDLSAELKGDESDYHLRFYSYTS